MNDFTSYSIVRCSNCGALFADKVFDSKKHYIQKRSFNFVKESLRSIPRKIHAKFYFNYLDEHLDLAKIKSVLDIGADQGHLMKLFEDKGIKTLGIEAVPANVKLSVAKNLRYGFFDENYIINESFDLVCLTQVMSYFRDNYSILRKVISMLNPGGYIFIATANGDSEKVINHFTEEGTPTSLGCILTRKNWIPMIEKIGCRLIDYSFYEPNMMLDISDGRRFRLIRYVLIPSLAFHKAGEDGYHIYMLLQH